MMISWTAAVCRVNPPIAFVVADWLLASKTTAMMSLQPGAIHAHSAGNITR